MALSQQVFFFLPVLPFFLWGQGGVSLFFFFSSCLGTSAGQGWAQALDPVVHFV